MADESETLTPVRMHRMVSSLPWSLVGMLLLAGGSSGHSAFSKVVGFGGAALFMLVSLRAARLRLQLGPDVVVVGWLTSTHYPWSEIDKFVLNDKGLAIRMRGGLEIAVPAYPYGGAVFKKMQQSMEADLEQVLQRAEQFRKQRPKR
ncbi:MAG TPA: hypothetical protein VHV82_23450 [Sporichthyaceae bacterium]|nr:hypothetical protein [Sporichthyaceae bacterium]